MAKSQTLIKSGTNKKYDKLNEGDLVIALQANRVKGKEGYRLMANMDWSFDDETTPVEIKSFLGGVLGSIEEVFGEKMVTEAITHYASETGKLVKSPDGKVAYLKSKGLTFKKK